MKKLQISSRAGLSAALSFCVLAFCGCAVRGVSAGQKFGDVAIQDIGRNWDEKVLEQYAGPEFYKQCPPERAKEICALLKAKLGPLKSYKGSTISNKFPSPTPGSTAPLVVGMTGEAEFEGIATSAGNETQKAIPANITVIVAEHDGRWTLNGFQVQSEALMNARGAQVAPRQLPPGMKMPPGARLQPSAQMPPIPPPLQPGQPLPAGTAPSVAPVPATPSSAGEQPQPPTEH